MNDPATRSRESHVRRLAHRMGLTVSKNPSRDDNQPNYGGFMLVDGNTNAVVAGGSPLPFWLSLDALEAELRSRN